MFDLEQQIEVWRRELNHAGITRPEVVAELENHLREQTARLAGSGLSGEEAFQRAAQQLGNSRVLKQEFSKVGRHRFWGYRDNPLALKILALSFILAGIDPLVTLARVWIQGNRTGEKIGVNLTLGLMSVIWSLRILIGIGLLWRSNAWRIVALIWSGVTVTAIPAATLLAILSPHNPLFQTDPAPATDFFMGFSVPFKFTMGLYFLNLAIMAWGLHTLSKRSVRNLFRPATAG